MNVQENPLEIFERVRAKALHDAEKEVADQKYPGTALAGLAAFYLATDLYGEIIKKLEAAEARIAAIEERGVEYRGVYQAAQEYDRGNVVTHAGSMWHANCRTRCTPGTGRDWTLCVKGGQR